MASRANRRGGRGSLGFFDELTEALCAFVAFLVEHDTPDKAGVTKRRHLAQAGIEVEEPDLPPAADHLLAWFLDLDQARGAGMGGLLPLTFSEIEAWARLTRTPVRPWEVDVLRAMDRARLSVRS